MSDGVWGFFYGGLINPVVQQRLGLSPRARKVATLAGYGLAFEPYVNLRRERGGLVYGLLMEVSHADLDTAYGRLAARYLPWPVVAQDLDGAPCAALCYLAPDMAPGPVEAEHVENLARPAEALGFPAWYVAHIRSFAPA